MSDLFFEAIPEPNIVLSCSKLGVDTADVRTRLFSITDYRGTLVILEVWGGRMDRWMDGRMDVYFKVLLAACPSPTPTGFPCNVLTVDSAPHMFLF